MKNNMKQVILTFSSQVEADNAVIALSKGYKVEQWYLPVNATMKPYCVGITVSEEDISEIEE